MNEWELKSLPICLPSSLALRFITVDQKKYGPDDVVAGKQAAKEELRRRLNLRFDDRPVVGIVTRLTAQKGIHLIKHAIWRTLERGGQVGEGRARGRECLLGTGGGRERSGSTFTVVALQWEGHHA